MKVVYTIPVRGGLVVPIASGIPPLAMGNVSVKWKADDEDNLQAVTMEFNGVALTYTPEGRIEPAPAHLREQAYRTATYVANRIYMQTSFDAIDPQYTLLHAPEILPENPDEEAEFQRTPRRMWSSAKFGYSIRGTFDPAPYAPGFSHSAAYGYYADALRAGSLFQKFELLYKVVEYFFPEDGPALDTAVSAYVSAYDASFTPDAARDLRLLRNRSIHPRARKGHVSPENIASVQEVRSAMRVLDRLATLLLEHPSF